MCKKKIVYYCVVVIFTLSAITHTEEAMLKMSFQGKLITKEGLSISTNVALTFRIYDKEENGTKLWEEEHQSVRVTEGLFNVELGKANPLTAELFETHKRLYLEIESFGEVLTPRQELLPTPYAFYSLKTSTATYLIGGYFHVKGNSVILNGNLGIGVTTTKAKLHVGGTNQEIRVDADESTPEKYYASFRYGALQLGKPGENRIIAGRNRRGGSLAFYVNNIHDTADYNVPPTDTTLAMYIDGDGNVGVGTTLPNTKFVVASGSISITGVDSHLIVQDGNVGIGTTDVSAARLVVNGPVRIGDYTISLQDGQTEDVLKIDNTGNVRWQPDNIATDGLLPVGVKGEILVCSVGRQWISTNTVCVNLSSLNVGIGTAYPNINTKLDVAGFVKVGGVYSRDAIQFEPQNNYHKITFNQLRFWDQGTGQDVVTLEDGNVGIGTINPSAARLVVNGTLRIGNYTLPSQDGVSGYVLKTDGNGNVNWKPDNSAAGPPSGSRGQMLVCDLGTTWSPTNIIFINLDANKVGIGTTNPQAQLHIGGTNQEIRVDYDASGKYYSSFRFGGLQLGKAGENRIIAGRNTPGGWLKFYVNNTNDGVDYNVPTPDGILAMCMAKNGFVGIGTDNPVTKFVVASGSITLLHPGSNLIVQNGSIGIGTTNLSAGKLVVNGPVRINNYTLTQYDGTAGYVLKTDGAGNVTWQRDDVETGGLPSGSRGQTLVCQGGTSWSPTSLLFMDLTNSRIAIGTTVPAYRLEVAGDIYANSGWLRTSGNTGWYSQTHGGGWYMTDSTWIRAYNNKNVWVDSVIGNNGGLTIGYSGAAPPSGGAIITGNVGIGTTSPQAPLHISSNLGQWGRIMRLYDPNMNVEDKVVFHLGKGEGGSAAEIGFLYRGDQAGNNALFLGHYGNPYVLNITKAGWVGIKTNNPQRRLHIEGDVYIEGYMGVGVLNLGTTYRLHVKGMGIFADTAVRVRDLVSAGNDTIRACRNMWQVISTCPSCSKLYKEDIKPLALRKEDVLSLQPVSFK